MKNIITSVVIAIIITAGTSLYFHNKEMSKITKMFPTCLIEGGKAESVQTVFHSIEGMGLKADSQIYMKDMFIKSECYNIIEQYMNGEIDL